MIANLCIVTDDTGDRVNISKMYLMEQKKITKERKIQKKGSFNNKIIAICKIFIVKFSRGKKGLTQTRFFLS